MKEGVWKPAQEGKGTVRFNEIKAKESKVVCFVVMFCNDMRWYDLVQYGRPATRTRRISKILLDHSLIHLCLPNTQHFSITYYSLIHQSILPSTCHLIHQTYIHTYLHTTSTTPKNTSCLLYLTPYIFSSNFLILNLFISIQFSLHGGNKKK